MQKVVVAKQTLGTVEYHFELQKIQVGYFFKYICKYSIHLP